VSLLYRIGWKLGWRSSAGVHLEPANDYYTFRQHLSVGAAPDLHIIGVAPKHIIVFTTKSEEAARCLATLGLFTYKHWGEYYTVARLTSGTERETRESVTIEFSGHSYRVLAPDEFIPMSEYTELMHGSFESPAHIPQQLLDSLIYAGVVSGAPSSGKKIAVSKTQRILSTWKEKYQLRGDSGSLLSAQECASGLFSDLVRADVPTEEIMRCMREFQSCVPSSIAREVSGFIDALIRTWGSKAIVSVGPNSADRWERLEDVNVVTELTDGGFLPHGASVWWSKVEGVAARAAAVYMEGLKLDKALYSVIPHKIFSKYIVLATGMPRSQVSQFVSNSCPSVDEVLYSDSMATISGRDFELVNKITGSKNVSVLLIGWPDQVLNRPNLRLIDSILAGNLSIGCVIPMQRKNPPMHWGVPTVRVNGTDDGVYVLTVTSPLMRPTRIAYFDIADPRRAKALGRGDVGFAKLVALVVMAELARIQKSDAKYLSERLGFSLSTVQTVLIRAKINGYIEQIGRWYMITDKGRAFVLNIIDDLPETDVNICGIVPGETKQIKAIAGELVRPEAELEITDVKDTVIRDR